MHFPLSVHRFPAREIALFAHHRHRTRACAARGRFFFSLLDVDGNRGMAWVGLVSVS